MIDYDMSLINYQRMKKMAMNLFSETCDNIACNSCPIVEGTPYANCYALEEHEPLLAIKKVSDVVGQLSVDWSQVKTDTKIYVRDSIYEKWIPRYFKEYKNGHIYVFRLVRTSFTAKNWNEIDTYKYGKLAE